MTVSRHRLHRVLLLLLWLAAIGQGCSDWKPRVGPPAAPPGVGAGAPTGEAPAPEEGDFLVHRVQWPGESLSIIAKWYTGDYRNWRPLLDNTPSLAGTRIVVGDRVRIPRSMIRNAAPMPRSFVEGHYRNGALPPGPEPAAGPGGEPSPVSPATPPAEEEEYVPVPFGPKSYPGG